jgi:hypothetical protein
MEHEKMEIRPLMIDAVARAKIAHLIEHARENHYHPGIDPIPGDDPKFVIHLNTYRVVFTFSVDRGALWRHLSISVPEKDKYPNPIAAFTIAKEFGFSGWVEGRGPPDGWFLKVEKEPPYIVIVQREVHDNAVSSD